MYYRSFEQSVAVNKIKIVLNLTASDKIYTYFLKAFL